uniref:DNA polymerase alpha/delta/epsilon subunit B domain-containing protein n=1 Tax=Phaeomonas parva TaxID=124430 RepID=A0A7S1XWT2_9STRA
MAANDLLAPPTEAELNLCLSPGPGAAKPSATLLSRRSCEHTPTWQRFNVRGRRFDQQFSHLYSKRYAQMKGATWAAARARWANSGARAVERIVQLKEGERTFCCGVLYKQMKLRQSVIDEYQRELAISGAVYPLEDYTSSEDALDIEDDSGRMRLAGDVAALPVHLLATGLTAAVLGVMGADGEFVVEDWCVPGVPPPLENTNGAVAPKAEPEGDEGPYLLLASGLGFGGATDPMPAAMLVDFVAGRLGGAADRSDVGANICRVILAGNSMAPLQDGERLRDKNLPAADQERIAGPLYQLDAMLAQLASACPVDVMPGADDASSVAMPQQPFHRSLLPTACRYSSLQRPPNPYEALVEGRLVLGSSGQPVTDLLKFTRPAAPKPKGENDDGDDEGNATEAEGAAAADFTLSALERMLGWRHMAPTAPDTLPCYPFYNEDPFVLEHCPQVFFAGNQKAFGQRLIDAPGGGKCLLLSVPKFDETREAVLVNLRTLEASTLSFHADLLC